MYSLQPVPGLIETKSGSASHSGFVTISFGGGLLAFVVSTDLGAFVVVAFVLVGVDIVGVLSRLAVVVVFGLAL